MTSAKPCIYPCLCVVVLLFGCNSIQHTRAEVPQQSVLSQQELEIPKDFAPFIRCIEEPTKIFRYAVREWRARVLPLCQMSKK